jgi:hypothetical protein
MDLDLLNSRAKARLVKRLWAISLVVGFLIGLNLYFGKYETTFCLTVLLVVFNLNIKYELEAHNIYLD